MKAVYFPDDKNVTTISQATQTESTNVNDIGIQVGNMRLKSCDSIRQSAIDM